MSFNLKLYLAGTKVKTQDKVETLENPQGYSYITFYHMCHTTGTHDKNNKTGLQPVSRPVELVHYFGGWVEGLWFITLEGG